MTIKKIISGGQTGADQGGLVAGKLLSLETGGTAPPKFMTETGSDYSLKGYGLVEGPPDSSIYRKRTKLNVVNSDGTLLMGNMDSPGSKLTIRYCRDCKGGSKPYIANPTPLEFKTWLETNKIETLNVAGNRERKTPGIKAKTIQFLYSVLGVIESA